MGFRHLYRELRRRGVFGALVAYLVVAWGAIEVAETTFPYFGLPDWAVRLVIVLAALGAPLALVLSWFFDIRLGTRDPSDPSEAAGRQPDASASDRLGRPLTIPTPATPILGRDQDLEEAERLLTQGTRLLTVTGAGGAGKSRLALELAHRWRETAGGGVVWVALASIREPELLPSAIGAALDVGETGDVDLLLTIADVLRDTNALLVLDNFEQILAAAPWLSRLLAGCEDLTVLVTSRAPLRIAGEQEFPLPPLPAPQPGEDVADLMASPAVRLFADQAHRVNPRFSLDADNVGSIAAICRRLDGLPLALELAAARTKLLTPESLLARLDRRLPLLETGRRDDESHRATLRSTIDWSYDLLEAPEQDLFCRLSVFEGGFTLPAAEAVSPPESGVLLPIERLVDHSLLVADGDEAAFDTPRFRMLEVIREYASERLAERGGADGARAAHAAYFFALAERAEPELVQPNQARWLDALDGELENLRAALEWLHTADPPLALRMALSLRRFWEVRGYLTEGRAWLDQLLGGADAPPPDDKLTAKGLYAAGVLADAQADYEAARSHFLEYLALNRRIGDRWGLANALNNLGVIALRQADHAEAQRLYGESARIWRELGNQPAVALSLNNLGTAARLAGDLDAASTVLAESLALHEAAGDVNGRALTLAMLGDLARDRGRAGEAEALYQQSIDGFREVGNGAEAAKSLLALGALRIMGDDMDGASTAGRGALDLYLRIGDPRGLADAFRLLAEATPAGHPDRLAFTEAAKSLAVKGPEAEIEEALRRAGATPAEEVTP